MMGQLKWKTIFNTSKLRIFATSSANKPGLVNLTLGSNCHKMVYLLDLCNHECEKHRLRMDGKGFSVIPI